MDKKIGVDKKISTKRRFLTLEDWLKIKSRYLHGDVIAVIARDYQMSRKTIDSRAKREGWAKHGSRKQAIENKIAEETEAELIDGYKVAVDEANEEDLEVTQLIQNANRCALESSFQLLQEKKKALDILRAEINRKLECKPPLSIVDEIEVLFQININNEVRNIAIASRHLQNAMGRNKAQILGIVDKPYLVDPDAEKEKAEVAKNFKLGVDKLMQLVDEDKERIKAEVRAEIMAEMELAKHSLHS